MNITPPLPHLRRRIVLLCVMMFTLPLCLSSLTFAQMTPEEAMQKLRASEKPAPAESSDSQSGDEPNINQVRRDDTGRWKWSDDDIKQIASLRKRIRKNPDGFFEVQTYTWIVRSDVSEQFTAELAWYMQLFAEAFPKIFPCPVGNRIPVKPTIVLYADQTNYNKIDGTQGCDGLFRWQYDGRKITEFTLYSYAPKGHDQQFADFDVSTIQHEGTHAMVQWRLGIVDVPNWFQEAHATYFECWDLGQPVALNREKLRHARSRRIRYLQYNLLLSGKQATDMLPSLRTLISLDDMEKFSRAGGPDTVTANYTAAELLMEYLLSDESRFNYYIQMFTRARDRKKDFLLSEPEIRTLEPKWHDWLNEQFKLPVPTTAPTPTSKN